MLLKDYILVYITIAGFVSYIPQIVRLIKTKSAEDCSISSWLIWTFNSLLYFIYICLEGVSIELRISQLLEVILIGTTALLVIVLRLKENKECKHKK